MKYEMSADFHQLYSPDDLWESQLVFDILDWKLRMSVPYFVERNRDSANEYRNGAWFAWPFHLKDVGQAATHERTIPNMLEAPPTILVDVALQTNYAEEDLPLSRWSSVLEGDIGEQGFIRLLQQYVDRHVVQVKGEDIFEWLARLKRGVGRQRRKQRDQQHGEA